MTDTTHTRLPVPMWSHSRRGRLYHLYECREFPRCLKNTKYSEAFATAQWEPDQNRSITCPICARVWEEQYAKKKAGKIEVDVNGS